MRQTLALAALALTTTACAGSAQNGSGAGYVDARGANAPQQSPAFAGQYRAPQRPANVAFEVVTVAKGLESPWGLGFLPDGRMLVTEQPGRLRIVSPDGTVSAPVAGLPPVDARGQGGLLGLAIDPGFATNHLIYWSYAEPREGGRNNTAVARGALVDGIAPRIDRLQVIFRQSPSLGSRGHFGGRLVWAQDGTLFVTLGDRQVTEGRMQAQRMDGLLGKIVRINTDGTVPPDNPFAGKTGVRPEIWSYGHRNIQAATLHPSTGELWESEHGTRGGDEVNVARKGLDYGWPTIAYGIEYGGGPITGNITAKDGMEQPRYYWDPNIAPSGMTFYTGRLFPGWQNSLFIGALAGESLVRLTIEADRVVAEERLLQDMGARIRDVVQGPDGALYLLTDDSDGRVLKLVPKA
jgi:aldose sugar dehydrogenase